LERVLSSLLELRFKPAEQEKVVSTTVIEVNGKRTKEFQTCKQEKPRFDLFF
jgi:hypothetical protein